MQVAQSRLYQRQTAGVPCDQTSFYELARPFNCSNGQSSQQAITDQKVFLREKHELRESGQQADPEQCFDWREVFDCRMQHYNTIQAGSLQ